MTNEQRAEKLIEELGFDFETISKAYVIGLFQNEINDFRQGSSEYIRLLCGYLYCLGDESDIPLIKKAKYGINMDVGCMIDIEWIESLENGGNEDPAAFIRPKNEIVKSFVDYYSDYFAQSDDDND